MCGFLDFTANFCKAAFSYRNPILNALGKKHNTSTAGNYREP